MSAIASTDFENQYSLNKVLIGNKIQDVLKNVKRQQSSYGSRTSTSTTSDSYEQFSKMTLDSSAGISQISDIAQVLL